MTLSSCHASAHDPLRTHYRDIARTLECWSILQGANEAPSTRRRESFPLNPADLPERSPFSVDWFVCPSCPSSILRRVSPLPSLARSPRRPPRVHTASQRPHLTLTSASLHTVSRALSRCALLRAPDDAADAARGQEASVFLGRVCGERAVGCGQYRGSRPCRQSRTAAGLHPGQRGRRQIHGRFTRWLPFTRGLPSADGRVSDQPQRAQAREGADGSGDVRQVRRRIALFADFS